MGGAAGANELEVGEAGDLEAKDIAVGDGAAMTQARGDGGDDADDDCER
jgi:hypothetical protein